MGAADLSKGLKGAPPPPAVLFEIGDDFEFVFDCAVVVVFELEPTLEVFDGGPFGMGAFATPVLFDVGDETPAEVDFMLPKISSSAPQPGSPVKSCLLWIFKPAVELLFVFALFAPPAEDEVVVLKVDVAAPPLSVCVGFEFVVEEVVVGKNEEEDEVEGPAPPDETVDVVGVIADDVDDVLGRSCEEEPAL